jgi:hypothetical protein
MDARISSYKTMKVNRQFEKPAYPEKKQDLVVPTNGVRQASAEASI